VEKIERNEKEGGGRKSLKTRNEGRKNRR